MSAATIAPLPKGVAGRSALDPLSLALQHAARGWIVLPTRDKQPLTRHGVKDATTDPDVIRAWWAENPDAEPAVTDCDVLDLDRKPNKADPLDALRGAGLDVADLPSAMFAGVSRGGKGCHVFGVGNVGNGKPVPGVSIDGRGRGTYVVALYDLPVRAAITGAFPEQILKDTTRTADSPSPYAPPEKNPDPPAGTVAKAREDVAAVLADMDRLNLLAEGATCSITSTLYPEPVGWDMGYLLLAQSLAGIAVHPDTAYTLANSEVDFMAHAPSAEGTYDPCHKWNQGAGNPHPYKPLTAESMFPDDSGDEGENEPGGTSETGVSIGGSAPLYVDLCALAAGGLAVPLPGAGPPRPDGHKWLYYGRLNGLFGDSESAKTLVALGVLAHELTAGGHGAFLDTDYNGPQHIVRTLLRFGVPLDALDRFRYVEPQSRETVAVVIADLCAHLPRGVVVLDSFGENIGLLGGAGASANVDEFVMRTHRLTSKPLADAGHCVVLIDHSAKNTASREYGATGSNAKKRIVDGAYLEAKVVDEFDPANGGQSVLRLKKDRTGGIRGLGIKSNEQVVRFRIGPLAGQGADGNGGSQTVEFLLPDMKVIQSIPNPRAATEAAFDAAGILPTDSQNIVEKKVKTLYSDAERTARGITRGLIRDVWKGRRSRPVEAMFPETEADPLDAGAE